MFRQASRVVTFCSARRHDEKLPVGPEMEQRSDHLATRGHCVEHHGPTGDFAPASYRSRNSLTTSTYGCITSSRDVASSDAQASLLTRSTKSIIPCSFPATPPTVASHRFHDVDRDEYALLEELHRAIERSFGGPQVISAAYCSPTGMAVTRKKPSTTAEPNSNAADVAKLRRADRGLDRASGPITETRVGRGRCSSSSGPIHCFPRTHASTHRDRLHVRGRRHDELGFGKTGLALDMDHG